MFEVAGEELGDEHGWGWVRVESRGSEGRVYCRFEHVVRLLIGWSRGRHVDGLRNRRWAMWENVICLCGSELVQTWMSGKGGDRGKKFCRFVYREEMVGAVLVPVGRSDLNSYSGNSRFCSHRERFQPAVFSCLLRGRNLP